MFIHLILKNDLYAATRLAPRKVNLRGPKRSDFQECFADPVSHRLGIKIKQTGKNFPPNIEKPQLTCQVTSSDKRIPFQVYDSVGKTALHRAVINLDRQSLTAILGKMTADDGMGSLRIQDVYGNTAAHYAAMLGRNDIMTIIMNKIPLGKRFALCSVKNFVVETTLHCAAFYGSAEVTECIRENLPENERRRLAMMVNKFNTAALAGAVAHGRLDTVEILKKMLHGDRTATINSDPNLVQTAAQPATSQYTDRYEIHNPSTGVKIYALTLYNPHERHGAEQEAKAIDGALQKTPCNCGKKQWWKEEEFYDLLTSQLLEIKLAGNCGLLMLFVMSHGSQGALHDKDGRRIFINDILHQVTHHIGDKVPLALVVQACQRSTGTSANNQQPEGESQHDAVVALAERKGDEHIKLLRPNTLLITPLAGEAALRGVYIPAMASQLLQADGEKSLIEMHKAACRQINKVMALGDTC